MQTDLVLSPFNASSIEMLDAARIADQGGFRGVWTFDHFSGIVADADWSRDPLVILGAIAAVTERVRLGVLVANIANRAPAQFASALNTMQSLAPDRIVAGIGAGAGSGSRFASEQEAIGRSILPVTARREALVNYGIELKSFWSKDQSDSALRGVVDQGHRRVPLIVGASSPQTIQVAAQIADGVNIRAGKGLESNLTAARKISPNEEFEISVFDRIAMDHPYGGDQSQLQQSQVAARTLVINAPYDLQKLEEISDNLISTQNSVP